jgi:hypothetical protein
MVTQMSHQRESHYSSVDEDEDAAKIDKILNLLTSCKFSHTRTRESAEKVIEILESISRHDGNGYHTMSRGLVEYPDLLTRYLNFVTIDNEDLKSMICRCIELHPHSDQEMTAKSLTILLNYWYRQQAANQNHRLEIMLMYGKYKIDVSRYCECKKYNVRDIYYEKDLLSLLLWGYNLLHIIIH